MSRIGKVSLLAAAVASAMAASQAQAAMSIALQFAPGQNVAGATFMDANNVKITQAGGSYQVNIYAIITGSSASNNGWVQNYINAFQSAQTAGAGAFTAGGINPGSVVLSNSAQLVAGFQTGTAAANPTDGLGDWGSTSTASTTKTSWFKAVEALATGPVYASQSNSEISTVSQGTWELLLGSFTITPTALTDGGTTTYTPFVPPLDKNSGTSTVNSTVYFQDGVQSGAGYLPAVQGVNFIGAPEPASLGVLALGGLALLARRRKTA